MPELVTVARFVVPGKPVPKARPRFDPRSGRTYTPAKSRRYERVVAGAAATAARFERDGDDRLIRRGEPWPSREKCKREQLRRRRAPTPKCSCSWCSTEYEVALELVFPDRRTRDLDNVAKAVLDGCTGVLWRDDRQICGLSTHRSLDRKHPRVEVTIRAVRAQHELRLVGGS